MNRGSPMLQNDDNLPVKEGLEYSNLKSGIRSWSKTKVTIVVAMVLVSTIALSLGLGIGLTRHNASSSSNNTQFPGEHNNTVESKSLQTWWHKTGEVNSQTPVQNENVRQSHMYSVQVSPADSDDDFHDSFVYETIPRSGKGKACRPDNLTEICPEDDGITIEEDIGVTMAWSQFLYGSDVNVKISLINGSKIDVNRVTIRPTYLDFDLSQAGSSTIVKVPYTPASHGVRFSIELEDDLWEYRNADASNASHYVQDIDPSGQDYVGNYQDSMPVVGREPRNALMIFASPFPVDDDVPPTNGDETYVVQPGRIPDLQKINSSTVLFGPGVYYATGGSHVNLSETVSWVHLAAGSYVKGAIQYNNGADQLKATGYGVLSGEQYVYQANVAQGYRNNKSGEDSVKMWSGQSVGNGQSWTLKGITVNAPPFNSMDFYGNVENFTIHASDYKQVGAFYTQTDGLQMYPYSQVQDIFYHSGDDTVKTYYSNIDAKRIVVWKTNNAPVVQLGWQPRDLNNVTLDQLDVIHSRYNSPLDYAPRAIIGSSSEYENTSSTSTADTSKTISDYRVTNLRSEGISPNLISLNLLSNLVDMKVDNAWLEELTPQTIGISTNTIRGFTETQDGNKVSMGNDSISKGLEITNYSVGSSRITFDAANWDANNVGGFWVDSSFDGKWNVD